MSDDRFEAELAALQPRRPSEQLTQRIERRLARRPRWGMLLFLVLVAIVPLLRDRRQAPSIAPAAPTRAAEPSDGAFPPTLQAYRRALGESLDDLEAMLVRHSSRGLTAVRISDPDLFVSRGEQ